MTAKRLAAHGAPEAFDAVLVDAPCSSEGNVRKHPDALDAWAQRGHGETLRARARQSDL